MKPPKSKFTTTSTTSQEFYRLFQWNLFVFGNSVYLTLFKLPKLLFLECSLLRDSNQETIQPVSICKSALSQQFSIYTEEKKQEVMDLTEAWVT